MGLSRYLPVLVYAKGVPDKAAYFGHRLESFQRENNPFWTPVQQTNSSGSVDTMQPSTMMQSINHYTVQRVVDVNANIDSRDLGSVAAEIKKVIAEEQKNLPSTVKIFLRGQNEVMETSFRNLGFGLILAIVLVYAVLVVLFQSWVDPFIIMAGCRGVFKA